MKDLTNEKLLKRFKSQFELVDHAIGIAVHMIRSGKEGRGKSENQNVALEVIDGLQDNVDPHNQDLRDFFRSQSELLSVSKEIIVT